MGAGAEQSWKTEKHEPETWKHETAGCVQGTAASSSVLLKLEVGGREWQKI